MSKTTRRGFLACLAGLAALVIPARLLGAEQPAEEASPEVRLPQVQPFRALVNGELFNLHRLQSSQAGLSDRVNRDRLADTAAIRFGQPGWRQLRFAQRVNRGGAVIPSYVWC